jgi:hypothetical protein
MPNFLDQFGHSVKAHWKTFLTVLVLIVLGVVVSAFTVYLEHRFHRAREAAEKTATETTTKPSTETPTPATETPAKTEAGLPWEQTLLLTLLDHAGVGLFAAAILGLVIELPHMNEYFQKRIQNTILNRNFIKQLSKPELERLQEQSLEAHFGVEGLNREGGFYKFYTKRIRSLIAGAFRTNTTFEVRIALLPNSNLYKVTETISYICKRGSEGLPEEARWTSELNEIDEVLQLEITTSRPEQGAKPEVHAFDKTTRYCHPSLVAYDGHGYILPLTEYAKCAELAIKVTVTYTISRERPFSWTMPCLTDSLSGDIFYPDNLEIVVDLFGLDEGLLHKPQDLKPENGFYKFRVEHNDWLLPDDGFGFYFRPKKP